MKITYWTSFIISCLLGGLLHAQSIKGSVKDANTGEPIPFANVFFSGTLIGASSDIDGNFSFDIPTEGKYELIGSYVGYHEYVQSIIVEHNIPFIEIALKPEVIALKDIQVNADTTGWKNNYPVFRMLFLGETENAAKAEIINPRDIFLFFDKVENGLFAHSKKEIVIENRALGYQINYSIKNFMMMYRTGEFSSFGIPRFVELPNKNNLRAKRWEKARKKSYLGSFSHFLNSLITNSLSRDGFVVHELHKVPNKKRPSQEIIDKKLAHFRSYQISNSGLTISTSGSNTDSIRYWSRLNRLPAMVDSLGVKHITNRLLVTTDETISYRGYLQIVYTKEGEDEGYARTRIGGGIDNKQTSTVLFLEPLKVYPNGYYDASKVFFFGYLGWSSKLSEMLPLGYVPDDLD